MKFLSDSKEIYEKINHLVEIQKPRKTVKIAVAFWGKGAQTLFESTATEFKIVCNLRTGGTNPSVIEDLASLPNVKLKQHDTLHAKILIADSGVIISSANFSTNGLSFEGDGLNSWLEAGVSIKHNDQQQEIQEIEQWFDKLWKQSRSITPEDLKEAQRNWKKRKKIQLPKPVVSGSNQEGADNQVVLNTVDKPQRGRPVYLRSASAILAFDGQKGKLMPADAFIFVFAGETGDAFEYHKNKFERQDENIRLKEEYLGYFIGKDGTMESCTDKKRQKVSTAVVRNFAKWMLEGGVIPEDIGGLVVPREFNLAISPYISILNSPK